MARQWTSVLRRLIRSAGVLVIVASCGVTTHASLVGGSAIQQSPRLIDVVAGLSFGCVLSSDGSVHCWGANDKGQLGIGTMDSASHGVTRLPGDFRFRSLRAGFNTVCGVTEQDDAFCWGAGDWAQLGNGRFGHSAVPALVAGGLKFRAVMPYCWGYQHDGRLGNGEPGTARNVPDLPSPVPISTDATLTAMAGRSWHTCASAANGDLSLHCRPFIFGTARAAAAQRRVRPCFSSRNWSRAEFFGPR